MSSAANQRPVALYDGQCRFCKRHIARWRESGDDRDAVEFLPYQQAAERFPHFSREELGRAMHLVEPDGTVTRAAEAVLRVRALNRKRFALAVYQSVPGVAPVAECAYRWVARHRDFVDPIDRAIFGSDPHPNSWRLTRSIFLRLLGVIYLIAFVSLSRQVQGLVGSNGILPASSYLAAVRGAIPDASRFWELPTLCWFSSSDRFLTFLCDGGIVMSVLLIVGIAPMLMLVGLWAFYLSLVTVGQDFLGFQWDSLLLETGLAAMLLAPAQWMMRWRTSAEPSRIGVWLMRWLAFRIMFLSGITKLLWHDESWRDGTALNYHYWSQPLPPWTAWYMNRLPQGFGKLSIDVMFFAELVLPFLIFTPRIPRRIAFWGIVTFQAIIAWTGNYGFFNILTIVICISLLDDSFWPRWLRSTVPSLRPARFWRWAMIAPAALLIFLVTCVRFAGECRWNIDWPQSALALDRYADPFRSANGYGLFRVMTKHRYEIIVEGSDNGVDWLPYEFKWKAGDVNQRPAILPGHMPRLDWQMWFAALEDVPPRWFINFMERLLEGSPQVTALLRTNPFPVHPPRYVRAMLYDYRFEDDPNSKAWWKRKEVGIYVPPVALGRR